MYMYRTSLITRWGMYLLTEFVDLALIRGQHLFDASVLYAYAVGMGQHNLNAFAY